MDGFTISKADRFLNSGQIGDSQSLTIKNPTVNKESITSPNADSVNTSFADTLKTALSQVNDLQKTADRAAQDLATGRTDNISDVMIAVEKADIALKVMVQVRNKIVDAYQEIMKMQV